jgi:hypothetical protein
MFQDWSAVYTASMSMLGVLCIIVLAGLIVYGMTDYWNDPKE